MIVKTQLSKEYHTALRILVFVEDKNISNKLKELILQYIRENKSKLPEKYKEL
jgi:hypothetical protein